MSPEFFFIQYEKALASQDWKNVSSLIHQDACITFSTGEVLKGIEMIQKAFQRNFQLIQSEKYIISNIQKVYNTLDTAGFIFSYSWEGFVEGNLISGKGSGTIALIYTENNWKLIL